MEVPSEAAPIYDDFVQSMAPLIGDRLLAVYATGSIAHNAFLPDRSDADGLVILAEGWKERGDIDSLSRAWSELQSRHAGTPLQLQFITLQGIRDCLPMVDVFDWQTSGILVYGADVRDNIPTVSHEVLRLDMLLQFQQRYAGDLGRTLPYRWNAEADMGPCCRHPSMIVLWIVQPARILFTWETGAIASKAECVDWFQREHPGPSSNWMQESLEWRAAGFPGVEPVVIRWGQEIPAMTARFAAFLQDRLSGGGARFDDPVLKRPMPDSMRLLRHTAHHWLESVPALLGRYKPLAL